MNVLTKEISVITHNTEQEYPRDLPASCRSAKTPWETRSWKVFLNSSLTRQAGDMKGWLSEKCSDFAERAIEKDSFSRSGDPTVQQNAQKLRTSDVCSFLFC